MSLRYNLKKLALLCGLLPLLLGVLLSGFLAQEALSLSTSPCLALWRVRMFLFPRGTLRAPKPKLRALEIWSALGFSPAQDKSQEPSRERGNQSVPKPRALLQGKGSCCPTSRNLFPEGGRS